ICVVFDFNGFSANSEKSASFLGPSLADFRPVFINDVARPSPKVCFAPRNALSSRAIRSPTAATGGTTNNSTENHQGNNNRDDCQHNFDGNGYGHKGYDSNRREPVNPSRDPYSGSKRMVFDVVGQSMNLFEPPSSRTKSVSREFRFSRLEFCVVSMSGSTTGVQQ